MFDMNKFILLAARRSGTSLVIDCLNSHPDIHCVKRAFGLEHKIKNPTPDLHSGGFYLYRVKNLINRLRYYFARSGLIGDFLKEDVFNMDSDIKNVGFRMIYDMSLKYPYVSEWAKNNDIKVIHLIRKNILKTYVSSMTAPIHKMHHPREGEKITTVKINLDPDKVIKELNTRLSEIDAQRNRYTSSNYIEVFYEDFVENQDDESKKLLDFIGADNGHSLKSTLVKINPDSLEHVVENHEEIERALKGTPLEEYLY